MHNPSAVRRLGLAFFLTSAILFQDMPKTQARIVFETTSRTGAPVAAQNKSATAPQKPEAQKGPAPAVASPLITATLQDSGWPAYSAGAEPNPAPASTGDTVTYTAVISNTGTADATGVSAVPIQLAPRRATSTCSLRIEHEMGHRLGLGDSYLEKDRDSIMYGYLTVGERRLPARGQAKDVQAGSLAWAHFLTVGSNNRISAGDEFNSRGQRPRIDAARNGSDPVRVASIRPLQGRNARMDRLPVALPPAIESHAFGVNQRGHMALLGSAGDNLGRRVYKHSVPTGLKDQKSEVKGRRLAERTTSRKNRTVAARFTPARVLPTTRSLRLREERLAKASALCR